METILVLEDIGAVRKVFTTLLRLDGYVVLEAETADEAIDKQRHHHGPIHLLIANVALPGRCSGTQAALELNAAIPDLKILFTSGRPMDLWPGSDVQNVQRLPAGSYSFLAKPFTRVALMQQVRELLAGTKTGTAS